ncbi:MAG: hypothetical protein AB7U83_14810 [Vicinamibacterales bacterium]
MTRLALAIALVAALGCTSDSAPTAPSPTAGPNTGPWTGTAADAVNGTGTLHLDLTELTIDATRSLLGGTWRAEFTAVPPASGTVAGLRTGTTVQIVLQPTTPPPCPSAPLPGTTGTFSAVNLSLDGTAISGEYAYAACTGAVTGTLSIRRR